MKMKKAKPLEKEIERKVCDYAKSKGCIVYKFTSPNNRAVPDRIIISPHGKVGFLELKREGAKPTKLQSKEMAKLKQHGCMVEWVDNVFNGKAFVDELRIAHRKDELPLKDLPMPLIECPLVAGKKCSRDCKLLDSCMATKTSGAQANLKPVKRTSLLTWSDDEEEW